MAEKPEKLESVRQHADKLVKEMVDKGQIQADGDAAIAAAGIPTFSKGTVTLDPNTGRPVPPPTETPAFTDGAVQSPEQQTLPGTTGTPTKDEAQRLIAEHQARLAEVAAREQAAGATADGAPPSTQAPAGAAAGAEAAEAAAAAQIEYDEFEFEDPDLDLKYPIRVPKQFSESAKRGYGRRAAADRAIRYAKEADPVLRPLIEDGRIQQLLPLIQRALQDQAFGDYVYNGYQRAVAGMPLVEQARQEAAAAAAPVQPPGTQAFDFGAEDPYFAERVAPINAEVTALKNQVETFQRQQQEAARAQQAQAQFNQQRANEMAAAHQDLARAMPELYTGDLNRDAQVWGRTMDIAREAGYAQAYGLRAGIYFAGQQVQAIERERLVATASPAAAMLNAQQNEHMELARRQAAEASRTVGAGAATQAAPAPPPQRPTSFRPDGTLKRPDEMVRDNIAYIQQVGAGT